MRSLFRFQIFWILVVTIIGVFVLILLSTPKISCVINFSDSTGLYFYSALVQANAAILSIVGIFIVFQFQLLRSSIDQTKILLSAQGYSSAKLAEFERKTVKQKEEYFEIVKIEGKDKPLYENWLVIEKKIERVKSAVKFPTIFVGSGIILDSLGLLFASQFHKYGVVFESCGLWIFLLLEIYIITIIVDVTFKNANPEWPSA